MKRTLVALAVGIAALVPLAGSAHSPSANSDCDGIGDESVTTVALPTGDTLYLNLDEPSVWQESNGLAGLQTHAHTCTQKNDGPRPWPIVTIAADTRVL